MRIAIGPLFDEFGGISKHLRGIRKYSRHHVDILPTDADRARVNNDPAAIRRYQESARSKLASYDVLHSHVYLWHTQMSSRALGASQRWIHTYHTLYFNQDYPHGLDAKQLWINEDLTKLARAADAKISVGDWLARHLSDEHAISTRVVPNGVDVRLCEGANADRFVAKHGVRDFVLYLSSSKPIKNPGLFLELACRIPELNFVMIGRELSVTQLYQECGRPPPSNLTVIGEQTIRMPSMRLPHPEWLS